MRWIRSSVRCGSYAALFALVLQLAITFGHVHVGHLSNGAPALAHAGSHSGTPNGTAPEEDDDCAICAIAGLSASLVIPELPPLVFISTQYKAFFDDAALLSISDHDRRAFQARGPPA